MIYFDNNATTKPLPEVLAAVVQGLSSDWANPSSAHGPGRAAARAVQVARESVAMLLGVDASAVTFASGATEANEAVLRHHLARGHRLITSEVDHPALSGVFRLVAPDDIQFVPVGISGLWDLVRLDELAVGGDALIAVAWANGETGILQDVGAIAALAAKHRCALLVDASQVVGKMSIVAHDLGATYLTMSGHKFHGPKGIGALVQLAAPHGEVVVQAGGGQESGRRGGTENVSGILGLGAACRLRHAGLEQAINDMARLRNRFENALSERVAGIRINGASAPRVPNTSNVTFIGIDGMALVARIEDRGVICSQVSACSSARPEPSRTLRAMGLTSDEAFASIRFAFAVDNTPAEVELAVAAIESEVAVLRELMGDPA